MSFRFPLQASSILVSFRNAKITRPQQTGPPVEFVRLDDPRSALHRYSPISRRLLGETTFCETVLLAQVTLDCLAAQDFLITFITLAQSLHLCSTLASTPVKPSIRLPNLQLRLRQTIRRLGEIISIRTATQVKHLRTLAIRSTVVPTLHHLSQDPVNWASAIVTGLRGYRLVRAVQRLDSSRRRPISLVKEEVCGN